MHKEEWVARNQKLFADYQSGMPVKNIAAKYEVTGVRVRQLLKKMKRQAEYMPDGTPETMNELMSLLSVRCANVIRIAHIDSIEELLSKTAREMLTCRNFNVRTLHELKAVLDRFGWKLSGELLAVCPKCGEKIYK